MTAIIGSYEGGDPWTGNTLYREMMGQEAGGTTLFIADDNWTDYVNGAVYAATTTQSISAQKLWSIPLFANTSSLKEAASGADDKYFVQVAKELASTQSNGSIYVRTGWEFNGNWFSWSAGSDPADYIKAYQQFVDAFRSVSNRFVFTWCPAEQSGGMNPAAAYPGDAYVNIIGMDVYDNNVYDGNNATAAFNTQLNAQYGLNWLANFAAQHGKQIALPEWGVSSNSDAAFVTLMANWIKTNNVAYAAYWDADAGGINGLLSGMPAVEAAYVAAFGAPPTTTASTPVTTTPVTTTPPATTTHKAVADLDGDHKSDIVLYNSATHTVEYLGSAGGLSASKVMSIGAASAAWQVSGVGDFDGDGKADVLWMNSVTHDVQVWESSQGMSAHSVDLGSVLPTWAIQGVGDFDGDGKADILWENSSTHDVQVWESSKGMITHSVDLGTVSAAWAVKGVGDFDGDGKSDILWENSSTHDVQIWESSQGMISHSVDIGAVAAQLSVVGVGDFDGDGKSDILWWNATTRDLQLWESSKGESASTAVDLGTIAAGWAPVAVGDYDGDGKADILFENTTTHALQLWDSSTGFDASHAVSLGTLGSSVGLATTHV